MLADDGGARGASFIGFGEKAALKKTKAHEGEIVRGDVSAGGELCALDRIPWISLGVVNVVEIVSGHGKGADDGCVFNSCVSAKLADELLEEGLAVSVLLARIRVECDLRGDDSLCAKSGVDVGEPIEAAQRSASASPCLIIV